MVRDIDNRSPGTLHYNVQFKTGALANRVTKSAMCDIRPADIDWLWIVEQKRRATPEEIPTTRPCRTVHERIHLPNFQN
jgi:hypothetical protein